MAVLPWPLSNLSLRFLRKNLRDFPPSSRSTMGQMLPEGSATWSIGMSWAVIFCMAAITEIWWLTVGKIWQQFERAMNSRCLRCVAEEFHGFWIQPHQRRLPPGCMSCYLSVRHGRKLRLQTEARHSIKLAAAWRPPQPPQLELRDLGMPWKWCHTIFIGGMHLDSFSTDLYSGSCFLCIFGCTLTNCHA